MGQKVRTSGKNIRHGPHGKQTELITKHVADDRAETWGGDR
jgi:hypothetical protein